MTQGAAKSTADVVVVGGGAAGLLAAIRSAERGRQTLLLEKNSRPGIKILMSGGTRCNVTHATDARGIASAFESRQARFLRSALARFGPMDILSLLHEEHVPTKVEETGKIFPVSNRASDVLQALLRRLRRSGAAMEVGEPLLDVQSTAGGFALRTSRRTITASKLILTPGGASHPKSGTTGDGYCWARQLGHTVITPRPALTPLTSPARWIPPLKGITLADVAVRAVLCEGGRPTCLDQQRGSLLFTHFGLSGPVVLNISKVATSCPDNAPLELWCDVAVDLSEQQLDQWLVDQASQGKRQLTTVLAQRLPARFAETLVELAGIARHQRLSELSRSARLQLVTWIKRLPIPIRGVLGFKKAEVTAGGVCLDEVDGRTMESRRVRGCFLAGELLDVDGPIGGYNFQAAFSTGWLAGSFV